MDLSILEKYLPELPKYIENVAGNIYKTGDILALGYLNLDRLRHTLIQAELRIGKYAHLEWKEITGLQETLIELSALSRKNIDDEHPLPLFPPFRKVTDYSDGMTVMLWRIGFPGVPVDDPIQWTEATITEVLGGKLLIGYDDVGLPDGGQILSDCRKPFIFTAIEYMTLLRLAENDDARLDVWLRSIPESHPNYRRITQNLKTALKTGNVRSAA